MKGSPMQKQPTHLQTCLFVTFSQHVSLYILCGFLCSDHVTKANLIRIFLWVFFFALRNFHFATCPLSVCSQAQKQIMCICEFVSPPVVLLSNAVKTFRLSFGGIFSLTLVHNNRTVAVFTQRLGDPENLFVIKSIFDSFLTHLLWSDDGF